MPSPQKWRTLRGGRIPIAIATACAAIITPTVVLTNTTASATPAAVRVGTIPREIPLPAAMDLQQQYQGQSICDPVEKVGITKLSTLLRETYGSDTMYSTRACAADPTSEHTEGRALDWMVSMRVPNQQAKATAFLDWLLAPGADGVPGAMARRMGIMYIGWNNQIWRGYNKVGWGELKGCFAKSKAATSYDSYCHRNHVHFSMTWDGAAALTSYWDGTTQATPPCAVNTITGKKPGLPKRRTLTLPSEKKIFDSSTGTGNRKRVCRLQEPRWSGDNQRIDALVAGKGGIPANAVRAQLRVTAIAPNAPMGVYVWGAGRSRPGSPALTTKQNQDGSALVWVRLGRKGSVSIATNTGDAFIRISAVSYEVPAV